MVEINESTRTIKAKIVYYGPAVGGKTTNLKLLQDHAVSERRGMMISVNSTQERTILFDLLPLRTIGFRGYDLRLQVIGVAGQSMYAPSRRTALKDADGLVFVANSAIDRWEENLQAYAEMTRGLVTNGVDIGELSFVLQYNKRDLPESTSVEIMERGLNPRGFPSFPAVARTGEGVLETFAAVLRGTVRNIANRYTHLELPKGLTPEAWTQVAIRGMFGRASLMESAEAAAAPPIPTQSTQVIKISPGKGPDGRLDNRSPEAVAESYAEASAELGMAVADMREERDQANLRLEEVQRALEVSHDLGEAGSLDQGAMRALSCLAEAAEATHATLLLRRPAGWDARPLPPLHADPLLANPAAADWLDRLDDAGDPVLCEATADRTLKPALEGATPAFSAVLIAPVRDPAKLFGLAMLYYAGDVPLPDEARVAHVGLLARVFAAPLELIDARDLAAAAERLQNLIRSGDAAAAWSIAALSRGELGREAVDLSALVGPLQSLGIDVSVGDGAVISAHPDLAQLAVLSLVRAGETRVPGSVTLSGGVEGDKVRLEIRCAPPEAPEEEEAILALVAWIVETCCSGRFENAIEAEEASYRLWFEPPSSS